MEHTFKSSLWQREWRIDNVGVHEFRQDHLHASVMWFDLEHLDKSKLRGTHGAGFTVLLRKDLLARFLSILRSEWQRRFPERYRANESRILRRMVWFAFLWMPLTYILFCGVPFVAIFIGERHGKLPPARLLNHACLLVVVSVASLCFTWVSVGLRYRKFRRGVPVESCAWQTTQPSAGRAGGPPAA